MAQTRSFTSMLVGVLALAALGSGHDRLLDALTELPEHGGRLLAEHGALAQSLGRDASIARVFFLGSGPRYGLACEAMLKMKEMSLTASEAYHFLEFRHGPKSMVDADTLVVGLLSESAREAEAAVLREMKGLGARVLVLAERAAGLGWADHVVPIGAGQPELAAPAALPARAAPAGVLPCDWEGTGPRCPASPGCGRAVVGGPAHPSLNTARHGAPLTPRKLSGRAINSPRAALTCCRLTSGASSRIPRRKIGVSMLPVASPFSGRERADSMHGMSTPRIENG